MPYVVSVHTARPGECADYVLSAYADAMFELSLIEASTQRVVRGMWRWRCVGLAPRCKANE